MKKIKISIYLPLLCAGLFLVIALLGFSQPAEAYVASEYSSDARWSIGTPVALSKDGKVVKASSATSNYLGVVADQSRGKVVVADSGIVSVLVSDQDGSISIGSRLGVSSITGVATLWREGNVLVGVAKDAPKDWQKASVQSEDGKSSTVRVASVSVQLMKDSENTSSITNPFLSTIAKVASGVAGHPVDTWRIITSLFIGLGGLILSFGLLFVSSRESFFSIGRNPMAGTAIMKGLWKMAGISVLAMCITLGVAYLIVRIG